MKKLLFTTVTLFSFGLVAISGTAMATTSQSQAENAGNSTQKTLKNTGNDAKDTLKTTGEGAKDTLHETGTKAKDKMEGAGRVPYRGLRRFFIGK